MLFTYLLTLFSSQDQTTYDTLTETRLKWRKSLLRVFVGLMGYMLIMAILSWQKVITKDDVLRMQTVNRWIVGIGIVVMIFFWIMVRRADRRRNAFLTAIEKGVTTHYRIDFEDMHDDEEGSALVSRIERINHDAAEVEMWHDENRCIRSAFFVFYNEDLEPIEYILHYPTDENELLRWTSNGTPINTPYTEEDQRCLIDLRCYLIDCQTRQPAAA